MKEEYLILQEEILHLDTVINNTINFFYVFMASYIAFSLTQDDTIFLLLSYMVIFPAYMIVLNKMQGMCKIGSYLYIYHEKKNADGFKWEIRSAKYRSKNRKNIFSHVLSSNFPFLLVSLAVMFLFFYNTKWEEIFTAYESIKLVVCVFLNIILLMIIFINRNISTNSYIKKWRGIE